MTPLRRKLGKVVALFLLAGTVLWPLRAVAATVLMRFAYDAVVLPTATVRVGTGPSLRPDRGSVHEYVYDDAHDGYDDTSNALVVGGAGAENVYDPAFKLALRREVHGEGAIYDNPAATTAAEGVGAYEVGTYDALKASSLPGDALDIHHVGQAHAMEQIVPGYSRATGPAIALPQAEHAAIPTLRGTVDMSPRSLLARDIWNLRQYTNTPNSSLQQLIELNKTMYPEAFAP